MKCREFSLCFVNWSAKEDTHSYLLQTLIMSVYISFSESWFMNLFILAYWRKRIFYCSHERLFKMSCVSHRHSCMWWLKDCQRNCVGMFRSFRDLLLCTKTTLQPFSITYNTPMWQYGTLHLEKNSIVSTVLRTLWGHLFYFNWLIFVISFSSWLLFRFLNLFVANFDFISVVCVP